MRNLLIILLLGFMSITVRGQLEVGLFGGGSFYMGDLNPSVPFLQTNPAIGLLARYNLNSRWVARLSGYQGVLTGDDDVSGFLPQRSLSFRSGITELAGIMEFHFLPYYNGSMKEYWTPYLFGGAAMLYHRPQRNEQDLRDFGTEGQNDRGQLPITEARDRYSYFAFSIPFGMGIKYSFSKRISATIEWGMRKTFVDYIDDVSTTYYLDALDNPDVIDNTNREDALYSDPLLEHNALMQRGNSKTTDWYSFAGLTLTYYIDMINRNKCSDFEERY
ncbi:MAG: hypothetical protein KDC05_03185 [Bacteroidales bacterium]|nr:hypothetical protein [Bacteroidales bacterium]